MHYSPEETLNYLKLVESSPEAALSLLRRCLDVGTITAHAGSMRIDYPGEASEIRKDQLIPWQLWANSRHPPAGHQFWKTGAVQFSDRREFDVPDAFNSISMSPTAPTIIASGVTFLQAGLASVVRTKLDLADRADGNVRGGVADDLLVLLARDGCESGTFESHRKAAEYYAAWAKGGQKASKTDRLRRKIR